MIDKLLIGPLAFEIQEVQGLTDDEGKSIAEEARADLCTLLVESDLHPHQKMVTIFHEIVHLVLDMAGRDYDAEDESLVTAITNGMLTTLIRNPRLIQMLAEMIGAVDGTD